MNNYKLGILFSTLSVVTLIFYILKTKEDL